MARDDTTRSASKRTVPLAVLAFCVSVLTPQAAVARVVFGDDVPLQVDPTAPCDERLDVAMRMTWDRRARRIFETHEEVAARLVDVVEECPEGLLAAAALVTAGNELTQGGHPRAAFVLYDRAMQVEERWYAQTRDERAHVRWLAELRFRRGVAENAAFEFDAAIASFGAIADDPRLRRSDDPDLHEWREDALVNTALLLLHVGRWVEAERAFQRLAREGTREEVRRAAEYFAARIAGYRGLPAVERRRLRAFIAHHEREPDAAELVGLARARLDGPTEDAAPVVPLGPASSAVAPDLVDTGHASL